MALDENNTRSELNAASRPVDGALQYDGMNRPEVQGDVNATLYANYELLHRAGLAEGVTHQLSELTYNHPAFENRSVPEVAELLENAHTAFILEPETNQVLATVSNRRTNPWGIADRTIQIGRRSRNAAQLIAFLGDYLPEGGPDARAKKCVLHKELGYNVLSGTVRAWYNDKGRMTSTTGNAYAIVNAQVDQDSGFNIDKDTMVSTMYETTIGRISYYDHGVANGRGVLIEDASREMDGLEYSFDYSPIYAAELAEANQKGEPYDRSTRDNDTYLIELPNGGDAPVAAIRLRVPRGDNRFDEARAGFANLFDSIGITDEKLQKRIFAQSIMLAAAIPLIIPVAGRGIQSTIGSIDLPFIQRMLDPHYVLSTKDGRKFSKFMAHSNADSFWEDVNRVTDMMREIWEYNKKNPEWIEIKPEEVTNAILRQIKWVFE